MKIPARFFFIIRSSIHLGFCVGLRKMRIRERDQVVPSEELTPQNASIHTNKETEVASPKAYDGSNKKGMGRWMVIDTEGRGTVQDLNKQTIMHQLNIHARDLRILDPWLSYPSAILVRDSAILVNLEHIKAIITTDEVWLRDPSEENVIPIIEELQRRLSLSDASKQEIELKHSCDDVVDESPLEFGALEVTLEAVCSFLGARTTELENAAYPALDEITSKVNSRNLDQVRKIKGAMTRLTTRVLKVRDELEQLLDDDGDMADLYLSRKLLSPPYSPSLGSKMSKASRSGVVEVHGQVEDDVEEVEMLLEAYFSEIDATLNKLTVLREYIDDTEDYINIQTDNRRNQLIKLELFLNAGVLALSFYSLVTGIFGVNLPYTWNQNHGYLFKWVVILTGIISTAMFGSIITFSRYKGLIG